MGNKHQSGHNGQQHDYPHNAGKSAGSPLEQASAQRRFDARDHSQSAGHEPARGGQQAAPSLRSTPAQADREKSLTASVRQMLEENPIPVALVGFGIGAGVSWLIMNNRKPPANSASRLVDRMLKMVESRGLQLERTIEQLTPTSALAISAAMLTAGVGFGLAAFGSRDESSWLGKARQQLVEVARGLAHDAIERESRAWRSN
ncbi:MAG TPA: hypothetical protein VF331_28615 [Polyangiales bacterium]